MLLWYLGRSAISTELIKKTKDYFVGTFGRFLAQILDFLLFQIIKVDLSLVKVIFYVEDFYHKSQNIYLAVRYIIIVLQECFEVACIVICP